MDTEQDYLFKILKFISDYKWVVNKDVKKNIYK